MAATEVKLYVYDLSRGMARAMSEAFLGIQIDAVYHTSLVFGNVEYLFGAGVQTCDPGSSHHGSPMEVISLGNTHLPLDDILEYLDSLKEIYTPESYDLFAHNCNNFTNDFATFLVGKGIPDHITSLPQTVLNTPFGQMLRPQLDASMRMVTQAPVRPPSSTATNRHGTEKPLVSAKDASQDSNRGKVRLVTTQLEIDALLSTAQSSYAVIFFASGAYPPCDEVDPTYIELAAERPEDFLIKVDIDHAPDVALRYNVKATPTFQPFIKGRKAKAWTGTDVIQLRKKVAKLDDQAHPAHVHTTVKLFSFTNGDRRPVLFGKTPPLDKLTLKMGGPASDPSVKALVTFLNARTAHGASEAPLPDLVALAHWLQTCPTVLKPEVLFTAYDLFRCAMADPRICGYFVDETPSNPSGPKTLSALLTHVKSQIDNDTCPYNLQLVALQLCNNIFSSSLGIKVVLLPDSSIAALAAGICTSTLTAEDGDDPNGGPGNKPALKAAAANLAFNLTTANFKVRIDEEREALVELLQLELCAAILEFLQNMAAPEKGAGVDSEAAAASVAKDASPIDHQDDQNHESVLACLLALGYLLYYAPTTAEVWDLTRTMDARLVVQRVAGSDDEISNVKADVCRLLAAF